ncbi:MAG: 3-phosphoshikimate 1-carboxyvinyltransferase [Clostridia bacterium]|nr:3-phosphoshikimate 1-carboxyvinyltransferase [Clostridia bacterium]
MDITITPKKLSGKVCAVASKSFAHRIIIAAALSDKPTKIYLNTTSEDIEATLDCMEKLGAKVQKSDGYILITPIKETITPVLDCNESGSTARFLLPVSAVLCDSFEMIGKGRLPERPFTPLINEMRKKGVEISNDLLPFKVTHRLCGGEYQIAGNVSSQYITGLMLALPLCSESSKIILTSPLESKAYVDITIEVLGLFGINIEETENGYRIEPQKFISPGEIKVEGDWSNSAFWIVANKLCGNISVDGVNYQSTQGDMKILEILDDDVIDAKEIPDLVPILAVCACAKKGKTLITNAERLRIKESDRLNAVTTVLNALGADIRELPDGLEINGTGELHGGECDGFGDHRIVMSAAIASVICKSKVTIHGAEAVNKSYPTFFEDFKRLNGDFVIY